jgi:hypothetical protein
MTRRGFAGRVARTAGGVAVVVAIGCAPPKLAPMLGDLVPAGRLPRAAIAPGHHKVVFSWEVSEYTLTTRGDGAARLAAPDSARLDFFLGGGFGNGGAVVMIGDSLRTPPGADAPRGLIPSATLLWAVLGRVSLPNLPDTVIRVEGATLRADVGRPTSWRLSFHGDSLFRVERVQDGRVAEWVERSDPSHIKYRNESARRTVQLTITKTEEGGDFDAAIWEFDR